MTAKPFQDLAARIKGRVLTDKVTRAIHATGACLFRVEPQAVAQPEDVADLREIVKWSTAHNIPIVARGGGTSRCGNELGSGLVIDFSRHLDRVLEVNEAEKWVRVQPGLILARLNQDLAGTGLFFPIDPSTGDVCTLGGMIANNSSGPHAVKYGTIRDHVLSLEVILADGTVIETGPTGPKPHSERQTELEAGIGRIIRDFGDALISERPEVIKNSAGYHLWDPAASGRVDLTPLLVGSEGTLGLIVSAKLALSPRPQEALMGLLHFDDLAAVGRATELIREMKPSMIEIIERRILDLARDKMAAMRPYLPEGLEAVLLVEMQGDNRAELEGRFRELAGLIIDRENLAIGLKLAADKAEMAQLAKVRAISGPMLNRAPSPARPVAVVEDAAVHPKRLSEYIAGLREIFSRFKVDSGIYGHAGDGELHVMVFFDLTRPEEVDRMKEVAQACHELVWSLKGTISGEHGDGRLRSQWLPRQYPKLHPAFGLIKKLFDPQGILNPGVIVADGPDPFADALKFVSRQDGDRATIFDQPDLAAQIEACSGCRKCLAYCPAASTIGREWATGRAKTTILRGLTTGHISPDILADEGFKRVVDACLNCKRCLTDCPSGVDVPWLAIQARAQYLARHGLPLGRRLMADSGRLALKSGPLAPLMDLSTRLAPIRKLMEATVGLDSRRQLPRISKPVPTGSKLQRPGPGREVVLFPGCLERRFEAELTRDAIIVLEANGFEVTLADVDCCGAAGLTLGQLEKSRENAGQVLEKLMVYVDQGLDILFSEPSCALAVRDEYPRLLETEQAKLVAGKSFDIYQFLLDLQTKGELKTNLSGQSLKIGYHQPCHLRALGSGSAPARLLEAIPGLEVIEYPDICCGMAGTFGLKKESFDLSLAIGEPLFQAMRASGVDEITTGCGACRMQISQALGRKCLSPISLLARAYK